MIVMIALHVPLSVTGAATRLAVSVVSYALWDRPGPSAGY
jgi:hypothetical protein